jgi:hypothetical protein
MVTKRSGITPGLRCQSEGCEQEAVRDHPWVRLALGRLKVRVAVCKEHREEICQMRASLQ